MSFRLSQLSIGLGIVAKSCGLVTPPLEMVGDEIRFLGKIDPRCRLEVEQYGTPEPKHRDGCNGGRGWAAASNATVIWEQRARTYLLNGPEGEVADELWEKLRGPNEVHLNVLSWTPKAITTRWSWLVTSEPSTRKPGAFERSFDVEFLSDRTRCITLTGHDAVGTYLREPIRGTYDCSNWTRRE